MQFVTVTVRALFTSAYPVVLRTVSYFHFAFDAALADLNAEQLFNIQTREKHICLGIQVNLV